MKTCPKCFTQNRDLAKFCQNCAASLEVKRTCPNCGSNLSSTARFCHHCSAALQPISQPSTPFPVRAQTVTGTERPAPLRAQTGQLSSNTMLGNRYLVLRKLGQGGFGAVYLVNDTRLGNKPCALKEMSDSALVDALEKQKARDAFHQEARLLSTLSHYNLPRVTDYFSEGEKQFLVMDYLEGQTLADLLETRTELPVPHPVPETQVVNWAEQLCDVLQYLHMRNPPIIFRDIKPGNIMVSPDGQTVKLIDFGIARLFKAGAGKDTTLLGTPGYAPQEQYGKGQSDARSDVYALGATLHHVLTLRDPGDQPFKFPPVRSLNPHISPELDKVVARAVELLPANRWQSADEMKRALQSHAAAPGPSLKSTVSSPVFAPTVVSPAMIAPIMANPAVSTPSAVKPVSPPARPIGISATCADNRQRFNAFFTDGLIVAAGIYLLYLPFRFASSDEVIIFVLLTLAWSLGYYTFYHARHGQTPGKKWAKIKVVRRNGSPLTWRRSLWRAIAFLVIPNILNLVYLGWLLYGWPLFQKDHCAFHDLLADTWVIKA